MSLTGGLAGGSKVGGGGGGNVNIDILLVIAAVLKNMQAISQAQKQIDGLNKTTKEGEKAGKDAARGSDTFQQSLDQLTQVAFTAIGSFYTLQKVWQATMAVGQQGSAFRQMEQSWDSLSQSVGANTDLLMQLQIASRGTIDEMSLMSSAAVSLAGASGEFGQELSQNLPRILEIAKAAEKANPALGDTSFMFQSLTVGLKRLSPRLIDNTGLQIRLSEAYEKLASERGKAADELTSEEQQLALLNATLQAGDRLIEQVGGDVSSLTDEYASWEANTKTLGYELKAIASETINLAAAMNTLIFGTKEMGQAYEQHISGLHKLEDGMRSYSEYVNEAERSTEMLNKQQLKTATIIGTVLGQNIQELAQHWEDYKRKGDAAAQSTKMVVGVMEAFGVDLKTLFEGADIMPEGTFRMLRIIESGRDGWAEYEDAIIRAQKAQQGFNEDGDISESRMLNFSEALQLATSDTEKIAIAQAYYGDEIDKTTLALLEQQRQEQILYMAQTEMSDKQREMQQAVLEDINAKIEAKEAYIGITEDEAKAVEEASEREREALKAVYDMLNRDIDSPIASFIEDMQWMIDTGGVIEQFFTKLEEARQLPPELRKEFAKEAYVATVAVQYELGMKSEEDVQEALSQFFPSGEIAMSVNIKPSLEAHEEGLYDEIRNAFLANAPVDEDGNIDMGEINAIFNVGTSQLDTEQESFVRSLLEGEGFTDEEIGLFLTVRESQTELNQQAFRLLEMADAGESITVDALVNMITSEGTDVDTWLQTIEETDRELTMAIVAEATDQSAFQHYLDNGWFPDESLVVDLVGQGDYGTLSELLGGDLERTITVTIDTIETDPDPDAPGHATGGTVSTGQMYVVGEHGPEMFVPDTMGQILSSGRLRSMMGSGGGGDININIPGAQIANDIDLDILAREMAKRIQYYTRRRV